MSGHLSPTQIEDYCRHKLAATELLSLSDHLCACAACRSQIERVLNCTPAYFGVRSEVFGSSADAPEAKSAPAHLVIEQIEQLVDGTLDGEALQAVQDHAAVCELCTLAIADLRAFRSEVAATLDHEYRPTAHPAPVESRRHRLLDFLPSSLLSTPAWSWSAALAVLLLAGAGGLVWQFLLKKEIKQESAAATPPSAGAPVPAPEATPPAALVQLVDGGGRMALDGAGRLSGIENLPPAYRRMVRDALEGQRLERSPLLAGLSRPASPLMGSGDGENRFPLSEPVGQVVLSDRPAFRWSPLDGASGYTIEVYDEKFNLAAASSLLEGTAWTCPEPLRRGGIYSWQVRALKKGLEFRSPSPPAPQAKFRILDQAGADELQQAIRACSSSHLALALLYARAGLLDQAERELRALQKSNPESAVVTKLLESLRKMKPGTE